MTEFIQHPVVQALAWALVHFVWQGAAIGLVAFAAFRVVRASASARYAIGVGALVAMLAAPVTTFLVFANEVPAPVASHYAMAGDLTLAIPAGSGTVLELNPAAPAPRLRFEAGWLADGVFVWLAGVMFFSVRLAGGWIVARRYARRAVQPASQQIQALARQLADRLSVGRAVRVLQSGAVAVPVMIGWLKPTIVFPMAALSGLSPAQVEALLAHELAHVRRHDYLVNLLQSAAEALLFYHPAVWWLSRRVRADRELCCDDLAIGVCDRLVYATALTDLAAIASPAVALAATDGDLLGRVRRILGQDPAAPAARAGLMPVLALAAVAGIGVPAALASTPVPAGISQVAQVSGAMAESPAPAVELQGSAAVRMEPGKPTSLTFDHLSVQQTPPPASAQTAAQAEELKRRLEELTQKLRLDEALRKQLQDVRAQTDAMRSQSQKLQAEAALEQEQVQKTVDKVTQAAREAEIQAARKALADVQRQFEKGLASQSQVNEARAALAKAEAHGDAYAEAAAQLEQASVELQRGRILFERGLTARDTVAQLEAAVAEAERRLAAIRVDHQALAHAAAVASEKSQTDARRLHEVAAAQQAHQAANERTVADALRALAAAQRDKEAALQPVLQHIDPSTPVQAGDVLHVTIKGEPALPATYQVAADGTIRLPFLAGIKVTGLTAAQVRDAIGKQLAAKKLGSVDQVTVTVARPGRQK